MEMKVIYNIFIKRCIKMSKENNERKWKKVLKEKNIKYSSQRKAILKLLCDKNKPLKVKEIHELLKKEYPRMRLSTIYRNMNIFVEKNLVKKIHFEIDKNETYFELKEGEHHHHLVCVNCNQIKPLECPISDYLRDLVNKTAFTVLKHSVNIYGLCESCSQKK